MKKMKTTTLSMRIDPVVKQEADSLFSAFGITTTDAINIFLAKSIMERGLPFELKQPRYNKETEDGMEEVRQLARDVNSGKKEGYKSVSEMFSSMGIKVGV